MICRTWDGSSWRTTTTMEAARGRSSTRSIISWSSAWWNKREADTPSAHDPGRTRPDVNGYYTGRCSRKIACWYHVPYCCRCETGIPAMITVLLRLSHCCCWAFTHVPQPLHNAVQPGGARTPVIMGRLAVNKSTAELRSVCQNEHRRHRRKRKFADVTGDK